MKLKTSIYPGLVLILSFLVAALPADQWQSLHQDLQKIVTQTEPPKVEYPKGRQALEQLRPKLRELMDEVLSEN